MIWFGKSCIKFCKSFIISIKLVSTRTCSSARVRGSGGAGSGRVERGVVRTFIQPERVFVWRSKERAPKQGRIGNLEKGCSGLEKSCHYLEKSGRMLKKKNSMVQICS